MSGQRQVTGRPQLHAASRASIHSDAAVVLAVVFLTRPGGFLVEKRTDCSKS